MVTRRTENDGSKRLIGYARVSTDEQTTRAQEDELRAAGCAIIYREHASTGSVMRPELARLMAEIEPGDVLTVVRLDRLARSVSHLLLTVESLKAKGAFFRSLRDPIDTSTAQGMFSLQVLGAVAQLERALISERTKAGITAARARGRVPGNPALKRRDIEAIAKITAARDGRYVSALISSMANWMPVVERMRPDRPWDDVVRVLNARGGNWTVEKLRRATRRLVRERLAKSELLKRAPVGKSDRKLIALIQGIASANPDLSLREIAQQLEKMYEPTPRGGRHWSASSVKNLLDRAPPVITDTSRAA
jgi:DNA invertase Pin-like site-specific DNA recombinase